MYTPQVFRLSPFFFFSQMTGELYIKLIKPPLYKPTTVAPPTNKLATSIVNPFPRLVPCIAPLEFAGAEPEAELEPEPEGETSLAAGAFGDGEAKPPETLPEKLTV